MARVALVFGGRSVEHQVSLVSARTVAQGLRDAGHEVIPCGVGANGVWLSVEESAAALDGGAEELPSPEGSVPESLTHFLGCGAEVAFPIIHGTWGEDGTLQGLFEIADLPYVGAGVTASALAMDKLLSKRVLAQVGVPVVEFEAVFRGDLAEPEALLSRLDRLPLPVFVKPSVGGSSVGIRKVATRDELLAAVEFALDFDLSVIVERGIEGRELECSVVGYPELEASVVGEIVPGADFYDYADKYLDGKAKLEIPAELDAAVETRLRELAVQAFAAVAGTGMARVDFLLEGDADLYLNEINTLPGFTGISMYPMLWAAAGLSLKDLVGRLVDEAVARHRDRAALDAGIKAWLAELGG